MDPRQSFNRPSDSINGRQPRTALLHTCLVVLTTLACVPLQVHADIKLAGIFGDNMVLQQGMPLPVWGWADDGEVVTVQFRDQKISTTAKGGKWQVKLRKVQNGG